MNQNPSHYPPQHQPNRPPHQSPDHQSRRYAADIEVIKSNTNMNQQPQAVSQDKKTLVEDIRSLLSVTGDMIEENIAEARKRLVVALEGSGQIFSNIEDKALEGAKCTDKALRDHPYQAVAIALGIGALIGHLITPRYSRSQRWLH